MTPKEKAQELFEAMSGIGDEDHHCTHYVAKQCALIAVDEIRQLMNKMRSFENAVYWKEVKQEIKKL
jgi:hypothetical protein